jgi:hypothetical protein
MLHCSSTIGCEQREGHTEKLTRDRHRWADDPHGSPFGTPREGAHASPCSDSFHNPLRCVQLPPSTPPSQSPALAMRRTRSRSISHVCAAGVRLRGRSSSTTMEWAVATFPARTIQSSPFPEADGALEPLTVRSWTDRTGTGWVVKVKRNDVVFEMSGGQGRLANCPSCSVPRGWRNERKRKRDEWICVAGHMPSSPYQLVVVVARRPPALVTVDDDRLPIETREAADNTNNGCGRASIRGERSVHRRSAE